MRTRGPARASFEPDSELTGADAETVAIASAASTARGEPWRSRFTRPEIEALLDEAGFRAVAHDGTEEIGPRFFASRTDDLPIPGFERLVVGWTRPDRSG